MTPTQGTSYLSGGTSPSASLQFKTEDRDLDPYAIPSSLTNFKYSNNPTSTPEAAHSPFLTAGYVSGSDEEMDQPISSRQSGLGENRRPLFTSDYQQMDSE